MPLAAHLRPLNLNEFVGQEKVVGDHSFLRSAILGDQIPSLLLWGPPGSGKTTLAAIIASETKAKFIELSAVSSGVKDLRALIDGISGKTILFIDEIHRWNKAQQDALLPYVEKGTIILIGATTENPSFYVNSALLSRMKVVILERLSPEDLEKIIVQAIARIKSEGIFEIKNIVDSAIPLTAQIANGDSRTALNILESCLRHNGSFDEETVKKIVSSPKLMYDKSGEEHYNLISALHKSMRGSDANAALYWLGRILESGEDPLYVARRLVRFASEDIGLINNSALMLATATFTACEQIGLPECKVNLAHCVLYLAKSKKDVTAYFGYGKVVEEINHSGSLPVPMHIRNASTKLMKEIGYGDGYKYRPVADDSNQTYLPEEIINKKFIS